MPVRQDARIESDERFRKFYLKYTSEGKTVLYGPIPGEDIVARYYDPIATVLKKTGELDSVAILDRDLKKQKPPLVILPLELWMSSLHELEAISNVRESQI